MSKSPWNRERRLDANVRRRVVLLLLMGGEGGNDGVVFVLSDGGGCGDEPSLEMAFMDETRNLVEDDAVIGGFR